LGRHPAVTPHEGSSAPAPGILFVCYANLCRSPIAERLAQAMLSRQVGDTAGRLPTVSAGTHARAGLPMHPYAVAVITERGGEPGAFRSRPLARDVLAAAGLVLTVGRAERAACVALMPGVVRRTFTGRQFGRLATAAICLGASRPPDASGPTDRLEFALRAATVARGSLQPIDPAEDDITDPIGEGLTGFRRCAAMIEAALDPAMRLIA
jgi:protein-tyrosine phosphatase